MRNAITRPASDACSFIFSKGNIRHERVNLQSYDGLPLFLYGRSISGVTAVTGVTGKMGQGPRDEFAVTPVTAVT